MHDLYDQNTGPSNIEAIWEFLTDADGDLISGDLGKVDLVSATDDEDTDDDERTIQDESVAGATAEDGPYAIHPDGNADNYEGTDDDDNRVAIDGADDFYKCSEDDGDDDDDRTICDATWSITHDVLFADGTFGCTATRSVTITCTWDADGGMAQSRNALPTEADLDSDAANTDNNRANFIKCEAE